MLSGQSKPDAEQFARFFFCQTEATFPEVFTTTQQDKVLPHDYRLGRVEYLNNVIEQDHRFIEKKLLSSQCLQNFHRLWKDCILLRIAVKVCWND